jgi:hypothetical protein
MRGEGILAMRRYAFRQFPCSTQAVALAEMFILD